MSEDTFIRPLAWASGVRSDVGSVRKVNEDAVLSSPEIGLWVVADGMGGHQVGDVASQMIVDALEHTQGEDRLSTFVESVEQTLLNVNYDIIEYAREHFDSATMGSTVVSLLLRGKVGVCLWSGDSRLYRLRHGSLTQLTRDHSHVQELIELGVIQPEEARNHPQANVITRAIGVQEQAMIDINVFNAQLGDTFLLCSDGLYNSVNEEQIQQLIQEDEAQLCADSLIAAALNNGASDNVSVVIAKGEHGVFEE